MSNARSRIAGVAPLPRRVEPELLDELPPADPRAVRSRADLRRVNRVMGNATCLLRELDAVVAPTPPSRLVELGAGDGSLLLRMARARRGRWPAQRVSLVDREPVVGAATLAGFRELGWQVDVVGMDVFDWLDGSGAEGEVAVFANLFLHHFEGEALARLLHGIARIATAFVCVEPRRSRIALAGSHLLGVIGCNDVTRYDAVLSVHGGFRDQELGALWPQSKPGDGWQLREGRAGLFGHGFAARRIR